MKTFKKMCGVAIIVLVAVILSILLWHENMDNALPGEKNSSQVAEGLSDDSQTAGIDGVLWIAVDGFSSLDFVDVPLGEVEISENFQNALEDYSSDTTFAVAICFSPMVPSNYLDLIEYESISASEYLAKAINIMEINPSEAKIALGRYQQLKEEYYEQKLDALSYKGEKIVPGDACKELFFFYTYLTKEDILQLKCDEGEALYIFSPGMVM